MHPDKWYISIESYHCQAVILCNVSPIQTVYYNINLLKMSSLNKTLLVYNLIPKSEKLLCQYYIFIIILTLLLSLLKEKWSFDLISITGLSAQVTYIIQQAIPKIKGQQISNKSVLHLHII